MAEILPIHRKDQELPHITYCTLRNVHYYLYITYRNLHTVQYILYILIITY